MPICNSRAERVASGCSGSGAPSSRTAAVGGQPRLLQVGLGLLGRRQQVLGEKLVSDQRAAARRHEAARQGLPVAAGDGGQPEVRLAAPMPARRSMFKTNTDGGKQRSHPADRGGARPSQRRPARRQGLADRAARKGLLPASAVRQDLDAGADRRRIGCRWTVRRRRLSRRRRRPPSSRVAGASASTPMFT